MLASFIRILCIAGLWMCAVIAVGATPDHFPSKPVRIIVPTSGGMNDVLPRLVAPKLSEAIKQPVIVEVKAGAAGVIAADYVAKSAPDGYTLLIGYPGPLAIKGALAKLPYDPVKAFAPITLVGEFSQLLVVKPDLTVSSIPEFIAYAKAHPGKLSYASTGTGGAGHLLMELFKATVGVDIVHVPYKGASPAAIDLVGGRTDAAFLVVTNVLSYVKSGRLKALAIAGPERIADLPAVPTLAEAGIEGFRSSGGWLGFLAPAGTPESIVNLYYREITRILKLPETRERLAPLNLVASTPAEFGSFIHTEISKWSDVVKKTGVRTE